MKPLAFIFEQPSYRQPNLVTDMLKECNMDSEKKSVSYQFFFSATLRKEDFKHGSRDGKYDDVTSRNETESPTYPYFLPD